MDGQILYVHTSPGERVGVKGVVEIGRTDKMYAVAEVYETDIIHVKRASRRHDHQPRPAGAGQRNCREHRPEGTAGWTCWEWTRWPKPMPG